MNTFLVIVGIVVSAFFGLIAVGTYLWGDGKGDKGGNIFYKRFAIIMAFAFLYFLIKAFTL